MKDPAQWGFYGVVVTGMVAILTEQIRSRRQNSAQTTDVRQEVVSTKDTVTERLDALAESINDTNKRLDDHIKWHLEQTLPIRIRG